MSLEAFSRETVLSELAGIAFVCWTCGGPDRAHGEEPAPVAGIVGRHSDGLHGYIGFSHEKLPAGSAYTAGMGFYAAVWPLVDQPIADFQIGLPSSWILPDNSDDKDQPLAP